MTQATCNRAGAPANFERRARVVAAASLFAAKAATAPAAKPSAAVPAPGDSRLESLTVDGPRLQVVMLVHPDMTALDLVGPQLIFATLQNVDVHLAWKDLSAVSTDSGLRILPTVALDAAPSAPDILFVPGGLKGTTAMMLDAQVIGFLRSLGSRARYVTSVCTGALLLGAAGLLRGYRATSHWYVRDTLAVFDAVPVDERVVVDRNRVTGGGVTAGLDMALTLSAILRGDEFARTQELLFEYAPTPPFACGTPELAGESLTAQVLQRRRLAIEAATQAAAQARKGWAG